MKIINSNLREGWVKLRIDVNDDLWYLESLVESGDFVRARTMRSVFVERGDVKIKTDKKPMTLKIQVEKAEYHKYANRLRIMGRIVEGPEDVQLGSYHTFEISLGSVLTLEKEKAWKKHQINKLKRAQIKVPEVLIVVVDFDEATFANLRESGVEYTLELKNPYSIQEERQDEFYKKICSEMQKRAKSVKSIILAGPGFAKEHVFKMIKEKYPDTARKVIIDSCSSATRSGINEVLKRKSVEKVVAESKVLRESQLVEKFFTHLRKDDGFAVYGHEEVEKAVDMGAVDTLLVSDEKIRDENLEKLARKVEDKRGKVEIIARTHNLGEQFYRMGGLGGLLRFKFKVD